MSYHTVLRRDDNLQNYLFALSDIEPNYSPPSGEDSFVSAPLNVRKHTRMLDGIALLFQYDKDVTAVAFEQKIDEVIVFWAKNSSEPTKPADQAYLDSLLEAFVRWDRPWQSEEILQMCVRKFRTKVLNRIKKATRCFPPILDREASLGITESADVKALEAKLHNLGMMPRTQSLISSVRKFLIELSQADAKTTPDDLYRLVRLAAYLTPKPDPSESSSDLPRSEIFNVLQLRAVRKIAAFHNVVTQVLHLCHAAGVKKIRELHVGLPGIFHMTLY